MINVLGGSPEKLPDLLGRKGCVQARVGLETSRVHEVSAVRDEKGDEPSVDIPAAIATLVESGYKGCWGIESCPKDGDEYEGARKTIALIRRTLQSLGVE